MSWQLQDAKARLSEVVKLAQSEGPQAITVHGKPAAVLVSREEMNGSRGADCGSRNSSVIRRWLASNSKSGGIRRRRAT